MVRNVISGVVLFVLLLIALVVVFSLFDEKPTPPPENPWSDGTDRMAEWSPDSSLIAYFSNEYQRQFHLMVMDADGGNKRVIEAAEPELSVVSWLPDSQHLLLSQARPDGSSVYLIDLNTMTSTFVSSGFALNTSPDGTYAVIYDDNGVTNVTNLTTGQVEKTFENASPGVWCPASDKLFFTMLVDGNISHYNFETDTLWERDPANSYGVWSYDCRHIAFTQYGTGPNDYTLHIIETDGSPLHQVKTDQGSAPSWAPNATQLLFTRNFGSQVFVIDPITGEETFVAEGSHPNWGNNGKIIFDKGGNLFTVNPDGTELTPLS